MECDCTGSLIWNKMHNAKHLMRNICLNIFLVSLWLRILCVAFHSKNKVSFFSSKVATTRPYISTKFPIDKKKPSLYEFCDIFSGLISNILLDRNLKQHWMEFNVKKSSINYISLAACLHWYSDSWPYIRCTKIKPHNYQDDKWMNWNGY